MASHSILLLFVLALGIAQARHPGGQRGWRGMSEEERVDSFNKNGYIWPPTFGTKGWPSVQVEESEEYKKSRDRMEAHIRSIPTYKLHWDEFFGLAQSRLMPSFTDVGFKKIKAPTHIWQKLKEAYDDGLRQISMNGDKTESFAHKPGSTTPQLLKPNFIPTHGINNQAMNELRPILEEWSGIELQNGQSYGIRVYKNGSTLVNHVDRSETHVISCIFHVGHDLDEPWPLEIEDHEGKIHAVEIEAGEMVMYESAKQYHARVTPMRGKHYGSVFIHYFPKHGWNWTMWDVHVAVPPDFLEPIPTSKERLEKGYDSGESNLNEYYRKYWEDRKEGHQPMAMGIDEPVQSMSHDEGTILHHPPKHVEL
mmetsp:Transcript_46122/g.59248  ORF Transcript_46122/g.59248 Transcript_46122/m.59248 type:complete len:366 (-) Transcript_46122:342-1439(-)